MRGLLEANANLLVPHYLIHSYLYYVLDRPVISDGLYDALCVRLKDEWDHVEHWHKGLVDHEALRAGTGFYLKYPERVIGAATQFYREFHPD